MSTAAGRRSRDVQARRPRVRARSGRARWRSTASCRSACSAPLAARFVCRRRSSPSRSRRILAAWGMPAEHVAIDGRADAVRRPARHRLARLLHAAVLPAAVARRRAEPEPDASRSSTRPRRPRSSTAAAGSGHVAGDARDGARDRDGACRRRRRGGGAQLGALRRRRRVCGDGGGARVDRRSRPRSTPTPAVVPTFGRDAQARHQPDRVRGAGRAQPAVLCSTWRPAPRASASCSSGGGRGRRIPRGWALDARRRARSPTADAAWRARRLTPLGGDARGRQPQGLRARGGGRDPVGGAARAGTLSRRPGRPTRARRALLPRHRSRRGSGATAGFAAGSRRA